MHIVHVLNKATVTSSAINVMNCSVNRGCSVSLITSSIESEALGAISSKLDIYILKNNLTSLKGLNELYLLVKKINPSILHSQHAKTGAIISIIAKLLKIPSLIENGAQRDNYNFINRILFTFAEMMSTQTVYVSNSVKKSLSSFEKKLVKFSKSKVIYYGIDVPFIKISKANILRKKYSISNDSILICHTGRFVEVKRQIEILNIFSKIIKIYNGNAQLLMCGDGPLKSRLVNEVERLKINDYVIFTGMINRDDIYTLLSISDYFIMLSKTEGHSLSLLEAMAYDSTPILSMIDSFIETVPDDIAIYIPQEGLEDSKLENKLLSTNKKSAQDYYKSRYNEGTMIDSYHKLYSELIVR